MLKNLVIDMADMFSAFSFNRAQRWLARSRWWADFAESIETGESVEDIQKQRGGGDE